MKRPAVVGPSLGVDADAVRREELTRAFAALKGSMRSVIERALSRR